jgi:hypothetical protein
LKSKEYLLEAVPAGRFLTLRVDWDGPIDQFIEEICQLHFERGRGFYEFGKYKKPQLIRENTQVVVCDKRTGEMFSGTAARLMIGLRLDERARVKPFSLPWYDVFIQSCSSNRRLKEGTRLLYEADVK